MTWQRETTATHFVLEHAVLSFDLALALGVVRQTVNKADAELFAQRGQLTRHEGAPVVGVKHGGHSAARRPLLVPLEFSAEPANERVRLLGRKRFRFD